MSLRKVLRFIFSVIFVPVFTVGITLMLPMFIVIVYVISNSNEEFKKVFPEFVRDLYKFAMLKWK